MKLTHAYFILILTLPAYLMGQGSDFIMGELNQVTWTRIVEPEKKFPVHSAVQVYSDGTYLSVAIKVIDFKELSFCLHFWGGAGNQA